MPTAPVDDSGTVLFYEDSGAVPNSSNYTTLVIYHGSAFTGNTFHKLLPLGAAKNVRLVILNRRHYAGSTKYTEDNIRDLNAGNKAFMERLALEVAYFLLWFAEKHEIPKISADRKSGGFAVMGWSMGNATATSVLGHPEVIGTERYQKLEPYFRKLVLYDPPFLVFGYEPLPRSYNPFTDPDLPTPQAVFENFSFWVSGYYDHLDIASRSTKGLDFSKRGTDPTIEHMTPEELVLNFDGHAGQLTEGPMFVQMQPALNVQLKRVLFEEKTVTEVIPQVEVSFIFCSRAIWYCIWGLIETERIYKELVAQGRKVRPIRFIEIPATNHFAHWDDPKTFFDAVVDGIFN